MKRKRKLTIGIAVLAGLCVALPVAMIVTRRHQSRGPIILVGAVLKQDSDKKSQSPIANVDVSAENGVAVSDSSSNFSGGFALRLRSGVKQGQPITLTFRHPNFMPVDLQEIVSDKLYVVRMLPLYSPVEAGNSKAEILVSNVLVRYSTEATSIENIGAEVKTFEVVNIGNIPCKGNTTCSPDGKWTAQVGSASLDAGEGNVFRNASVICIAGPCPFTRIDSDDFSQGGRTIRASVRNWSDTTTFLLRGDVLRPQVGERVRQSSAVIYGRTMNFTLPPLAQGPSIVAEMNKSREVFALGPTAILSWADCSIRVEKNDAKDYRCELKAGYRFQ